MQYAWEECKAGNLVKVGENGYRKMTEDELNATTLAISVSPCECLVCIERRKYANDREAQAKQLFGKDYHSSEFIGPIPFQILPEAHAVRVANQVLRRTSLRSLRVGLPLLRKYR